MNFTLRIKKRFKRVMHRKLLNSRYYRLTDEERHYLNSAYDSRTPLPASAVSELRHDNPRLRELQSRYAALDLAAGQHMQWGSRATEFINRNMRYFRGDSPYVWHYRELPRLTRLKYFIYLKYVQGRDSKGFLSVVQEDGAFGCWHYDFPDCPVVSRDLLDSVNEINFLDRHLDILKQPDFRILDIGAGYGRLAHRMLTVAPNIFDYCCVDAIPESSFICEYYLSYRGLAERGRVVELDKIETGLNPGSFNLAINIHSFSECTLEAVTWWAAQLDRLEVPWLLVIPNDSDKMLSNEGGGKRLDYRPCLEAAGYELKICEPVFDDPGVRDCMAIDDYFFLFERRTGRK